LPAGHVQSNQFAIFFAGGIPL